MNLLWKPLVNMFEESFVDRYLAILENKGIIPNKGYDKERFAQVRNEVRNVFACGKKTSIRPEEERLLYALSEIVRPNSVVGIGSYFGYAMSWIVAGMDPKGTAYLIDPNQEVSDLAQSNFQRLGLGERVSSINADFFDVVDDLPKTDLVWIDASGPKSTLNSDQRHKKIYGPIIESLDEKVTDGGIVLAHNVFPLSNKTGRFKSHVSQNYSLTYNVLSGCGLYIAKK